MQELIEKLKRNIEEMPNEQNSFTQGYKAGLSFVIECATNSLEKEKEQIKKDYHSGQMSIVEIFNDRLPIGDYDTFTNDLEDAEHYYNQTYNQNK